MSGARPEPYINFDYAKLNALARDFVEESMSLLGPLADPQNVDVPFVKKFMAFRDFAMAVAQKEREQVFKPEEQEPQ